MAPQPPKATAKKSNYSYGDFGVLNGNLGQAPKGQKKPGAKAGYASPVKPTKTPVENGEAGIIKMNGLTVLTGGERRVALAGGKKPISWSPLVGSSRVQGTYTPKGVKPLRPADGEVPVRATGSVSRPAGKPATTKAFHIPKLTASDFPREVPSGPVAPLSMGLTFGLGKANYDSGYFTDAADLK